MQETVVVRGESVTLATITIEALEAIAVEEKKGRDFNIALVAASIFSAGDKERGSVAWVKTLTIYTPDENPSEFLQLLPVACKVNGFKVPKLGEPEPGAPAAG